MWRPRRSRATPTPTAVRRSIADLHAARDAAKQRLADAVTALEGIRLNLLRLTAGTRRRRSRRRRESVSQ